MFIFTQLEASLEIRSPQVVALSRTAVTAVTAGAPWRREWTKLRDNGRV